MTRGAMALVAVALLVGAVWIAAPRFHHQAGQSTQAAQAPRSPSVKTPPVTLHPVHIRHPDGPPTVATGQLDSLGREIRVACASCHATRKPNAANRSGDDLNEFHQGLTLKHGQLACISCHNRDDYNALRLADGQRVEYAEVMKLCAQCHGPQYRDYQRGSHGGMTGFWDRTRGPRYRNNCIDCHDVHAPAFVGMTPAAGPRDRFLTPASGGTHE